MKQNAVWVSVLVSNACKLLKRRGSSVVEQPIRNRQVASSTLALGSTFFLFKSMTCEPRFGNFTQSVARSLQVSSHRRSSISGCNCNRKGCFERPRGPVPIRSHVRAKEATRLVLVRFVKFSKDVTDIPCKTKCDWHTATKVSCIPIKLRQHQQFGANRLHGRGRCTQNGDGM